MSSQKIKVVLIIFIIPLVVMALRNIYQKEIYLALSYFALSALIGVAVINPLKLNVSFIEFVKKGFGEKLYMIVIPVIAFLAVAILVRK